MSLIIKIKNNVKIQTSFDYLKNKGLISQGMTIFREDIEQAIGCPYIAENSKGAWRFLRPYLLLRTRIEAEGFFISQKGLELPSFKLLDANEMAAHGMKILMRSINENFKVGYVLAAADTSSLSSKEILTHRTVQKNATQTAILQQKILLENSFF